MSPFPHTLAVLALAALATAPVADAQRRAPADADAPGTLIQTEQVQHRSAPVSDQDVPGATPSRRASRDARATVSDQDDPTSPQALLAFFDDVLMADAPVNNGRDGARPDAPILHAANPFPEGRDAPVATAARRAEPAPRSVTANGRAMDVRPGAPVVASADGVPEHADAKTGTDAEAGRDGILLAASMPNPVSHTARISFTLARATDATLTLYDVRGREIASLFGGFADAGTHRVTVDVSDLAPGAYIYVLSADGERIGRQLQVAR